MRFDEAHLTLITLRSRQNCQKSRRFHAGRSPGQLQLGLARLLFDNKGFF
jgi:hypothetical protein